MPIDSAQLGEADIESVLEAIRPALLLDGGGVSLVSIAGNTVTLRMLGACRQCSSLPATKKYGIEAEFEARFEDLVQILWAD
ncbi:MAG: NifU family protein [Erythrobacter sp.]|nr:NifU family protein [Erythrobacter sp.]